jgi:hypothetical protein
VGCRIVCIGLATVLGLTAQSSQADRDWHEVTTSNVRIVSSANAAQTQKIAADVELYFEAATRVIRRPHIRPLVPVNMLALDRRLWRKYVDPSRQTDGLFSSYPSSAEIVFDASEWRNNSALVFHELTHLVLRQNETARGLPPWYNEGHAELLSTIEIEDGHLNVGAYPQGRLNTLYRFPRLPLEKVLTAGISGPGIGRDGMAAFYAQSWLIVHHAIFASPSRNEQLRQYRHLLMTGHDPHAAFKSVFGSHVGRYEMELAQYAARTKLAYISLPVASLNMPTPEVGKLSEADGLNALGRWLVYTGRVEEDGRLQFLAELAKNAPPESIAALQFANALVRRGELSTAKPLVEAGCGAPTEVRIALLCGDAYWQQFSPQAGKPHAPSRDLSLARSARKFYEAALRQEPDNLEALLSAAATFEAEPGDSAPVLSALESALQRNPNNSWISARLSGLYRPLDLLKARDHMERALLNAPDEEHERSYALELNRIGSELASNEP